MPGDTKRILCITLMLGSLCASVLRAQSATREYDLDEFMPLAESEPTATLSTGKPPTTAETDASISRLLHKIEDRVDPTSWEDRGGKLGSIQRRGKTLLITQTPLAHQALADLSRLCRMQITLEMRILTSPALEEWTGTQPGNWEDRGEDLHVWATPLDDRQVDDLLKLVQSRQDSTLISSPRLTLFNEQRGFVAVSTDTAYVKAVAPVVGNNGAVTFDPLIGIVSSGIRVDCRAVAGLDGRSVKLSLHPQLSKLISFAENPVTIVGKDGPTTAIVQIPRMALTEFEQDFEIPAGKSLLVRASQKLNPADPNAAQPESVYLLVRAKITTPEKQP